MGPRLIRFGGSTATKAAPRSPSHSRDSSTSDGIIAKKGMQGTSENRGGACSSTHHAWKMGWHSTAGLLRRGHRTSQRYEPVSKQKQQPGHAEKNKPPCTVVYTHIAAARHLV